MDYSDEFCSMQKTEGNKNAGACADADENRWKNGKTRIMSVKTSFRLLTFRVSSGKIKTVAYIL